MRRGAPARSPAAAGRGRSAWSRRRGCPGSGCGRASARLLLRGIVASGRRHRSDSGRSAPSAKSRRRLGRLLAPAGAPLRCSLSSAAFPPEIIEPAEVPDDVRRCSEYRFQNLHEFVKVARQNLNRNNWDYLIGGSEKRDDAGAQPAGARFDRLPAARAARRVERRCQPRAVRPEIAHPGAVRAGRLAWRISSRAAAAPSRRRPRKFGNGMILSSVSHPGLEKTAEAARRRVPHVPALCARRRGTGSTTMSAARWTTATTRSA